jgi:hypothetical protein
MLNLFGTLVVYALIAHQCGNHTPSTALYRTTEFTQKEKRKQIENQFDVACIEQNTLRGLDICLIKLSKINCM